MNEYSVQKLLDLMRRLRDPEHGCPWDKAQTFDSISKHTLEETLELLDAIREKDWPHVKEELGDLLLQIAYYTQMAEERGLFSFAEVAQGIVDKIMRRYQHVFGNERALSAEEVSALWEKVKAEERKLKPPPKAGPAGYKLPSPSGSAMIRTTAIIKRAAEDNLIIGCDEASAKVREELAEVFSATSDDHREEELGDLLFAAASLCVAHKVDPELALRRASEKFLSRWQKIYAQAEKEGTSVKELSAADLERLWNLSKGA